MQPIQNIQKAIHSISKDGYVIAQCLLCVVYSKHNNQALSVNFFNKALPMICSSGGKSMNGDTYSDLHGLRQPVCLHQLHALPLLKNNVINNRNSFFIEA